MMTSLPDEGVSPTSWEVEGTGKEKEVEDLNEERRNITCGGGCGGGGGGGGEGGIRGESLSRACAACKYQRRRCVPGCEWAPYFPVDRHQQFVNAHKLFGLRNLNKVLRKMKSPYKELAIDSMIKEANIRAIHPIDGCYGIVNYLREQIAWYENELNLVRQQIDFYRGLISDIHTNYNHHNNGISIPIPIPIPKLEPSEENFGSITLADDSLNFNADVTPSSSSVDYNFMIPVAHSETPFSQTSVVPRIQFGNTECSSSVTDKPKRCNHPNS